MAEAILNKLGAGKFHAFSAGSHPKGQEHPETLRLLQSLGYDTASFRSKSWDEFAKPRGPDFDFAFTVCDNAAAEECPLWLGQPMTAHWGVPDPASVEGTPEQVERVFREAFMILERRISLLLCLPLSSLDQLAIKREIDGIGHQ